MVWRVLRGRRAGSEERERLCVALEAFGARLAGPAPQPAAPQPSAAEAWVEVGRGDLLEPEAEEAAGEERYYVKIGALVCDRALLELGELLEGVWSCGEGSCGLAEAVGIGDSLSRGGKLSAAAVQQLLAAVQDAGKVTPAEEGTLRHLADKYSLGREAAAAMSEGIEASGGATTGKRAAGRSGDPATKKRR